MPKVAVLPGDGIGPEIVAAALPACVLLGLMALAALISVGCAGISPVGGLKIGPVVVAANDRVANAGEAKEAIGLLRDSQAFPYAQIESVEITPHVVTLQGYQSVAEKSEGEGGALKVGNFELAQTYNFSTFNETRNQISIWLSDIRAVTLEHVEKFLSDRDSDASNGYFCRLYLKDDQTVSFYSPDLSYIKRVALGFGFLAGVSPGGEGGSLNRIGIVLGPYQVGAYPDYPPQEVVARIGLGSPADFAGVPLGVKVVAVDGQNMDGDAADQQVLDALGSGAHTIKTKDIDSLFNDQLRTVTIP